ncbi:MAG: restriction endonuclease [Verrucomicrobia subdivision 3 bacterium]|nr:restriction endonuclease [Limisphaerales bacterium]
MSPESDPASIEKGDGIEPSTGLASTTQLGDSNAVANTEPSPLQTRIEELNTELLAYLASHPAVLRESSPRRFEEIVAMVLKDMRYDVRLTPERSDGGRNILAVLKAGGAKAITLMECRKYRIDRKIGIGPVQRFQWVIDKRDKSLGELIATVLFFTPEVKKTAEEYKYHLMMRDLNGLKNWLENFGTWTFQNAGGTWLPN